MMRTTLAVIALACAAECANPGPQAQSSSKKGAKKFTLTQVHNHEFQGHDAPSSFLRTHLKYGQTLPPQLSRALSVNPGLKLRFQAQGLFSSTSAFISELFHADTVSDDSQRGSVKTSISPRYDSEYSVPVQIGTPPQTIPLNLDTGSADL